MKRVITSLLLAPAATLCIFVIPDWALLVVIAALAVLCYREFEGLVAGHGIERPGPLGYVAGLVLLAVPQKEMALLILTAALASILFLRLDDLGRTLPAAAALLLGVVYVFGAWKCAVYLHARSPHWLLFALAINWAGDVAAYYVGRAIGKHKLAPVLSPGKSWEGSAASLVLAVVFGTLYLTHFIPGERWWIAAALSAAANVAGQFGDLSESALKRGAKVKDSGSMLPGHGGWLDRLDSSLFSLPVVYFFVAW